MKHIKKYISFLLALLMCLLSFSMVSFSDTASVYASTSVSNGIYYFENVKLSKYMQIDNNSDINTEQAFMELWGFSGAKKQRWQITHISDGYYKIQNVASGLVLAVASGNETATGDALVQEQYVAGETRQLWSFTLTQNGGYKIKAKSSLSSSSDLVMAGGSGIIISDGRNVEQKKYTNNSDYIDEWYLHNASTLVKKTLSAQAYYDPDCNYTASDLEYYYNEAVEPMVAAFHIKFSLSTVTVSSELSCSSDCDANYPSEICTSNCGSFSTCATTHHRSGDRLLDVLAGSGLYTCRFTAYDLCNWEDDAHSRIFGIALRGKKESVVSTAGTEDLYYLIQHELTHNLGTYDNGDGGTCNSNQKCVMKGYSNYWCDNCLEIILKNY